MLLWALEGRARRWDYIQMRARTKGVSPGSPRPCQGLESMRKTGIQGSGGLSGVQAVPGGSQDTGAGGQGGLSEEPWAGCTGAHAPASAVCRSLRTVP